MAQAGLKPWAQAVLTSAFWVAEMSGGATVSGLILMLHLTQCIQNSKMLPTSFSY